MGGPSIFALMVERLSAFRLPNNLVRYLWLDSVTGWRPTRAHVGSEPPSNFRANRQPLLALQTPVPYPSERGVKTPRRDSVGSYFGCGQIPEGYKGPSCWIGIIV